MVATASMHHVQVVGDGAAVLVGDRLSRPAGRITTTLHDLQSGTGHAVIGGGGLLPMSEVIRQASKAHHYLAVFDRAAISRSGQTVGVHGAADHALRQGTRLHISRMHRAGLSQPGASRRRRLGRRRSDQHHRRNSGVRHRQPARQTRRLAHPKTYSRRGVTRRSYRSSAVSGATSAARPGITPAGGRVAPGVAARRCLLPMCG